MSSLKQAKMNKNKLFMRAIDYLIEQKIVDSQKEIAVRTGISEPTLSNIRSEKKAVSFKTVCKLTEAFPGLFDIAYFRGESESMIIDELTQTNHGELQSDQPTAMELYDMMLKEKDERIRELQIHIDDQRIELANKERTIQSLVQQMATLNARLAAYQQSSLDNYPFHVGVSEPNSTHV